MKMSCFGNACYPGVFSLLQLKKSIVALALFAAFAINAEEVRRGVLADLSLEELSSLPVISVSKSAKPVSEASASVFVITNDDVEAAGSVSLPEALRLAPNLQVARVGA